MIKTTELMLGNIIEHDGKYHVVEGIGRWNISVNEGSIDSDYINPIPLTDGVLKRLGVRSISRAMKAFHKVATVHDLQILWRFSEDQPDYSLLLSPRYTTHDGIEVWEGNEVWRCNIENPRTPGRVMIDENRLLDCYYFSTYEACQSYIDSVTRKPIFTTEDGVDVFEGDVYCYVRDCGYLIDGKTKSSVSLGNAYKSYQPIEGLKDFSSPIIAQAYLNKVWAEAEYQSLLKSTSCQNK